jgi:hypothetical protein
MPPSRIGEKGGGEVDVAKGDVDAPPPPPPPAAAAAGVVTGNEEDDEEEAMEVSEARRLPDAGSPPSVTALLMALRGVSRCVPHTTHKWLTVGMEASST